MLGSNATAHVLPPAMDIGQAACNLTHGRPRRIVMIELFRRLLSEVTAGSKHASVFEPGDYRVAAAALLVHAAAIDGKVSAVEEQRLHALVKRRFVLDD